MNFACRPCPEYPRSLCPWDQWWPNGWVCMWTVNITDLNDWYKCKLSLQGTSLNSFAWCLFSQTLSSCSPCLFQNSGVNSTSQPTSWWDVCQQDFQLLLSTLLARGDIQVWHVETDKPISTQGLAMKRSVWLIIHIVVNRLLFSHPSFCFRARQVFLCSRKSFTMPVRQQVLNIFGFKPMIQCSNCHPSTILTHPPDFKSRISGNRKILCFLTPGYQPWFLAYTSLNFLGGPSHDFGLQPYVLDAQAGST